MAYPTTAIAAAASNQNRLSATASLSGEWQSVAAEGANARLSRYGARLSVLYSRSVTVNIPDQRVRRMVRGKLFALDMRYALAKAAHVAI